MIKGSPEYIAAWKEEADRFTAQRPYILPPQDIPVNCGWCWDTGICAECLGEYPSICPANCIDGTCHCQKDFLL